jgi:tRNA(Ile)-lysidine synthase
MAHEHHYWAIVHANFQLRGEESVQDEGLVRQLADQYGVAFFSQSFSTSQYSKLHKISTQMAARELRRAWVEKLLTQEGYQYVALAHHHNDQLETLLLNLAKGGGISGLKGMLPKNAFWIRPLLWATKEEIVNYAIEQGLRWREDRTNADDKYQRNWIRHQVIPLLQEINPSLLITTQHTVERLQEVEAVFQAEVRRVQKKAVNEIGNRFVIQKNIVIQHPQAASLLAEWLAPYGFSWTDVRQIMISLTKQVQAGSYFQSASHSLWIDRDELVITKNDERLRITTTMEHQESHTTEVLGGQLAGKVLSAKGYSISADPLLAALDYHKLKFPLKLRTWQEGDRFQPLGMNRKKKISDFLVDLKVPRYAKEEVIVLLSSDQIVWVVGYRISQQFRITKQTQQVYEIRWQPN